MMYNGKNKLTVIKKLGPMILTELYLIITLLLYEFGPITWNTENVKLFWTIIILAHIGFISGYLLLLHNKDFDNIKPVKENNKNKVFYWIFLILSLVATLIYYRNLVRGPSYIPYDFFHNFYEGLVHPAQQYYGKMSVEADENFSGNNIITGIFALIAFAHYMLIPVTVFLWTKITKFQKTIAFGIMFITFAASISVGTNKGIFDLLFLFATALIFNLVFDFKTERFRSLKKRLPLVIITVFLMIFSVAYFTWSYLDRVGTAQAVESISSEGNISLNIENEDGDYSFAESMYIGLTSYVTQGYYGMSLALDEEFDTTYGIGSSHFLMNVFKEILGIDVSQRTYQHKIDSQWREFGQWHSFYSQIANDVSFWGVPIILFIIGCLTGLLWYDANTGHSLSAKCLLILFVIMILYMPANNQIFNIMETFFTFWELLLFWVISKILLRYKNKRIGVG